jgi:hypothetical protein
MNMNQYSPDNFKQKEKIVNHHMAVPTPQHNFASNIVKNTPKIFKQ